MRKMLFLLLLGYSLSASDIQHVREAYSKGDYITAFTITKSLAVSGDMKAEYELGNMYYKGEGTDKNVQEAIAWWEKSGEQGYLAAQENLVYIHNSDKESTADFNKFLYWLKKASHQGSADMQFLLAYMYSSGEKIVKDEKKAFYWASKASEQNHSNAQFILGYMYCHAFGVAQDLNKCASLTKHFYLSGNEKAKNMWNEFSLMSYDKK